MTHSNNRVHRCAIPIRRLGIAVIILVGLAAPATAGVIRHDVQDSFYTKLAEEPQYSGVGAIFVHIGSGWLLHCSGTAIAPFWVLTAAHCVDYIGAGEEQEIFSIEGVDYEITDGVIHEGWGSDPSIRNWDIALLRVASEITGVNFAPLYTDRDEVGQVGTNVGFGLTGDGNTGAKTDDWIKRAGRNMISTTGGHPGGEGLLDTLLFQDFDSPTNPKASRWDPKEPLDLEIMPAKGDSGGGLFVDVDGTSYLAGVHSYVFNQDETNKPSQYGDVVESTRVSSYIDWIETHMVPAPAPVWLLAGGLPLLRWGHATVRNSRGSATAA